MEALILSCSTGGGHNAAAKALKKALSLQGWKATLMDPYTLRSQGLADWVGQAYVSLVQFSPTLFGKVYQAGELYEQKERSWRLPNPLLALQKRTALALWEYFQNHPIDFVICTHPYPGLILTWLKNNGYSVPLSLMVPTDYTCIPFEADILTDWMTIPHANLVWEFHQKGVPFERMVALGIPVDPLFSEPCSKEEAALCLGLPSDKDYILVAAGSMGAKGLMEILDVLKPLLSSKREVFAFCGTNEDLLQKVQELNHPAIQAVPFTTQMPTYLSLASLYITKPGGLSITEAATTGIPLILCLPIPGCESANALFFEKNGWAKYIQDLSTLPTVIEAILAEPHKSKEAYDFQFENTALKLAHWIEGASKLKKASL